MSAFMYYMKRIELLEKHAIDDYTNFMEYALEELGENICGAAARGFLTEYQLSLLMCKLESTVI